MLLSDPAKMQLFHHVCRLLPEETQAEFDRLAAASLAGGSASLAGGSASLAGGGGSASLAGGSASLAGGGGVTRKPSGDLSQEGGGVHFVLNSGR